MAVRADRRTNGRRDEPVTARDDFDCTVLQDGPRTTLCVRGELDSYVAAGLRECLEETFDSGCRDVVVDLTETEFLDSSALGVLVGALKRFRAAGGELRLAHPNARVVQVLDIIGLTGVFTIES
jgi:anti-sigma B factor antagonist